MNESFNKVFNYKPKEQDYRIWLVVNPSTWLIPILAATLLIALAVHSVVLDSPKYNFLAAVAEAPAAAAPAAEAPAPEAPPAE